MNKSLKLIKQTFKSSSGRTPEYLEFHRTFKKEFSKALSDIGCTQVEISKPNHFDASGFFTSPTGQPYYFRLEDLRWILIRAAKDYEDYSGHNWFVAMDGDVIDNIKRLIR